MLNHLEFSTTVTGCINETLNKIYMKRGGFNSEALLILNPSNALLQFVEDIFS